MDKAALVRGRTADNITVKAPCQMAISMMLKMTVLYMTVLYADSVAY